ncbi:MAG: VOC family protein [Pseudomonadota bacterium]
MIETAAKPRLLGINHVALEVGSVDDALAFYGQFFEFDLRGRGDRMAFIDLGDQFLALSQVDEPKRDHERHFGLVVDDREGLRAKLVAAGVEIVSEKRLDFMDPWGNRIEIVPYRDIQFIKDRGVLEKMDRGALEKTAAARQELANKGIEPHSTV